MTRLFYKSIWAPGTIGSDYFYGVSEKKVRTFRMHHKHIASATSKIYLRFALFILLALFTGSITRAQHQTPSGKKPVVDISDSVDVYYKRLLTEFGQNKEMPAALEKQILYALSYFPELAKTKIIFRLNKSTGGIIATRPTVGSLLRRSSKRKYIVFISDSIEGRRLPVFANSNVNGQVGILGHELCHIIYFSHSTGFQLAGLAISHVSKSYMDRFEYKTDSVDIVRGLGYQLIAWNNYLHKRFSTLQANGTMPEPKFALNKRYMSVEQIQQLMVKLNS